MGKFSVLQGPLPPFCRVGAQHWIDRDGRGNDSTLNFPAKTEPKMTIKGIHTSAGEEDRRR